VVTIYVPDRLLPADSLFPFYWMAITAFKPNQRAAWTTRTTTHSGSPPPTWIISTSCLFETSYPRWLTITMGVAFGGTFISLFASVLAAYAFSA